MPTPIPIIRVGTDCSGIEAPIQALMNLGIDFEHVFACEKDKYAVKSILANYKPGILYDDITTRDHSLLSDIDLYICGFPCQPFSNMGMKKGMSDPRSNIMEHCINVIRIKRPKYFILENVKGFKTIEKGKVFKYLLEQLEGIDGYDVKWDILNTRDYGIPQNRERIFFIGVLEDSGSVYKTPIKKEMPSLDSFIIDKTVYNRKVPNSLAIKIQKYSDTDNNYILLSSGFSRGIKHVCPTIRTGCHNVYYHKVYNRYLNVQELLTLQGFPSNFNQVVSDTQICKQIGNSMSVNVLEGILEEIIIK